MTDCSVRRTYTLSFQRIALILLGWAYCFFCASCSILTVVANGGERQIRPAPLVSKPGPRVLVFAIDGAGYNELMQAIRSGKASNLQSLLGAEQHAGRFAHGYAVPNALSILPSITIAAWASIFTGAPPGQTGVPGNEWFVREHRQFVAPAPVSIPDTDDFRKTLTDGLVGNALQKPTLYELLNVPSFVSLSQVYRGATLFTTVEPSAFVSLMTTFFTGVILGAPVTQEMYADIDLNSVTKLIAAINERGPPTLQIVYLPGNDLFTHEAEEPQQTRDHEPLPMQVAYLESVTDKAIGDVLNTYAQHGVLDETYVLVIADHGHTPVLDDDRHALGTEGDDEPPALIERTGFRLRQFVLNPGDTEQDYQATVAYQGAMAFIYLADRSTCPTTGTVCNWQRPPRFKADVMPVVRAFHKVNTTGDPIPQLKGTLDLIFAREPRPPGQPARPFCIFDGKRLVPMKTYLARRPRPDLPELEQRMQGLSTGPYGDRAGDILLLARSGLERPVEERFYFSGPYHSWHGSPSQQDSHIPFILARKGDTGAQLQAIVDAVVGATPSQLDFVPLVRALLGPAPSNNMPQRVESVPSPASAPSQWERQTQMKGQGKALVTGGVTPASEGNSLFAH